MKMKKFAAMVMALTLAAAMTACGGSDETISDEERETKASKTEVINDEETTAADNADEENTEAAAEEVTEEPAAENDEWTIAGSRFYGDGAWLFDAKNQNGETKMFHYNLSTKKMTEVNEEFEYIYGCCGDFIIAYDGAYDVSNNNYIINTDGNGKAVNNDTERNIPSANYAAIYCVRDDHNPDKRVILNKDGSVYEIESESSVACRGGYILIDDTVYYFNGNEYVAASKTDEFLQPDFYNARAVENDNFVFYQGSDSTTRAASCLKFDKIAKTSQTVVENALVYSASTNRILFTRSADSNYYVVDAETDTVATFALDGYYRALAYDTEKIVAYDEDTKNIRVFDINGNDLIEPYYCKSINDRSTTFDNNILINTDKNYPFVYNLETNTFTEGRYDESNPYYFIGCDSETNTLCIRTVDESGNTVYGIADVNDPLNFHSPFGE